MKRERRPSVPDDQAGAITPAEWDILQALWDRQRGTAREVGEELAASRAWAYSTVKTMLDRMVIKGLVRARQVGHVWEYEPAVAPEQARRSAWRGFVTAAFGGAMAPALAFVAGEARLSKQDREKLLAMLDDEGRKHK